MAYDREAAKAAGLTDEEIDAYLAEKEARMKRASFGESKLRSAGRAFESGALLGFADEATAGLGAAIEFTRTGSAQRARDAYSDILDAERYAGNEFAERNPKTNAALGVLGGIASLAGTAPGRALAGAGRTYAQLGAGGARVGALSGLGASNRDSIGTAAADTAQGAVIGGALGVAVPFAAQQVANAVRGAGRIAADTVMPSFASGTSGGQGGTILGSYGQAARQMANDVPREPSAWHQSLVRRADELGIPLAPGARFDDHVLRQLDAGFSSNPLTARPYLDARQKQAEVITDLVSQKLGMPADTRQLTPADFGEAVTRIKIGLDDIGRQIGNVKIDQEARTGLDQILARANDPADKLPYIRRAVSGLIDSADSVQPLTGERLMSLRSMFVGKSGDAWKAGSSETAKAYDSIVDVLDGLIERSAPGDIGRQYASLRAKWPFVKMLERRGVLNEASGLVSPNALRNVVAGDVKYIRGRDIDPATGIGDPLLDAMRITRMARDVVPDSGTATRLGFLSRVTRNPMELPGALFDATASIAARPVVNAYFGGGPVSSAVTKSLFSGPQLPARAGQIGVLSLQNAEQDEAGKKLSRRRSRNGD